MKKIIVTKKTKPEIESVKRKETITAYSGNWTLKKDGLNITLTSGSGFWSDKRDGFSEVQITVEDK